jgi:hypothetical protein
MSTMSKLKAFVSNLFARAERPVPRPAVKQKPGAVAAPQQSGLAQEHSSALSGSDYDTDKNGIRWHRI